jgi:hypothetical protein
VVEVQLEDAGGGDDGRDERSPEFVEQEEEGAVKWFRGGSGGCDEVCPVWSPEVVERDRREDELHNNAMSG